MPFLNVDIFDDLPLRLDRDVNPYLKSMIQGQSEGSLALKFGPELKKYRGRWREYFAEKLGKPVDKLVLEIGVHKGKVLRSLAVDNPSYGFLGMDITLKRVVVTAQRLKDAQADNALVLLGNAKFLPQLFAEGELDGILIFFPDPWTKKQNQLDRRLISAEFCEQMKPLLAAQGFFWLKTDCSLYFHESEQNLLSLGFSPNSAKPFAKAYESVFERRFKDQGKITFDGVWQKN